MQPLLSDLITLNDFISAERYNEKTLKDMNVLYCKFST